MAGASAVETNVLKPNAKAIAKKNGVLKPTEILTWKLSAKEIPKDWVLIDNSYFSVSYPACFRVLGEEGESDPKISSSLAFTRRSNCPNFIKDHINENFLTIRYFDSAGITSLEKAYTLDYTLLKQKVNLNGVDAVLFAGLFKENEIRLRWQIFTICNGKTFRIVSELPAGSLSQERVDKNNYDFPEDFKKIVSTFKCK